MVKSCPPKAAAAAGFGASKAMLASIAIGVLVAGGVTAGLFFGLGRSAVCIKLFHPTLYHSGGSEDPKVGTAGTAKPLVGASVSPTTLSPPGNSKPTPGGTEGTEGPDKPGPGPGGPTNPAPVGPQPATTTKRTTTTRRSTTTTPRNETGEAILHLIVNLSPSPLSPRHDSGTQQEVPLLL